MNTSDREEILMDTGAIVQALMDGSTVELALDEWVPYDPSCYQYETGWWAYRVEDEESQYFVSTSGIVYGETPTTNEQLQAFHNEVGQVVCKVCGVTEGRKRCNEFQTSGECRKVFS
jgi:hypothetical protein